MIWKKKPLTNNNTTGQSWDALNSGDVVVLKIFITRSIEVLARVTKDAPELSSYGDVVTLLSLGTVINPMLGERAVSKHAHAKWKQH